MAQMHANLVWSPIGPQLVSRCAAEGDVRLLIAPFIQRGALVHLLEHLPSHSDLKLITRWTAKDIASGASDPFVFEECASRNIPLYLHPTIHLKLFTMGSGLCFCGSANITSRALGLHEEGNIEAGVWSSIAAGDWSHVYKIINGSRIVDAEVFRATVAYRDKYLHSAPPLPQLKFPPCVPRDFTLASLPATEKPEDIARYVAGDTRHNDGFDVNHIMHDLVEFGGTDDLDANSLLSSMGGHFLAQPFVKQIVEHLRDSGSLSFGGMTAWIHAHCRNVPVPYRWEVKQATRILYNWLAYYVPEISWSVPGRHSQVIRWQSHDCA